MVKEHKNKKNLHYENHRDKYTKILKSIIFKVHHSNLTLISKQLYES